MPGNSSLCAPLAITMTYRASPAAHGASSVSVETFRRMTCACRSGTLTSSSVSPPCRLICTMSRPSSVKPYSPVWGNGTFTTLVTRGVAIPLLATPLGPEDAVWRAWAEEEAEEGLDGDVAAGLVVLALGLEAVPVHPDSSTAAAIAPIVAAAPKAGVTSTYCRVCAPEPHFSCTVGSCGCRVRPRLNVTWTARGDRVAKPARWRA